MHLTRYTDYSLRVLLYLYAKQGEKCTIQEIAAYYKISKNHLLKIVNFLVNLGYVKSTRGKGGGLLLAKPADKINIADVVKQVEPSFNIVECLDPQNHTCVIEPVCGLKAILRRANTAFLEELHKYTLADALAKKCLKTPKLFFDI